MGKAVLPIAGLLVLVAAWLFWQMGASGDSRPLVVPVSPTLAAESQGEAALVELAGVEGRKEAAGQNQSEGAVEVPGATLGEPESVNEVLLPSGECDLLVRRVGADPRGVMVTIQRSQSPFMGADFDPAKSVTLPLEPRGSLEGGVEFSGLADGTWSVELLDSTGRRRRAYHRFGDDAKSRELVLELGECSVEGHAWDREGSPAEGLLVRLEISSKDAHAEASTLWRGWTRTDEKGRYLLDGYRAGGGWMSVAWSDDLEFKMGDDGVLMSHSFGFRKVKRRVVDIGSPLGLVTIEIGVRDAADRRIRAAYVKLHSRGSKTEGSVETPDVGARIGDDGWARMEGAPGRYGVEVSTWDGTLGVIDDVEILGAGTFRTELQLKEGHSIFGTLVGEDGKPREAVNDDYGVQLRREALPASRVVHTSRFAEDGSFAFHEVKAGSYFLTRGGLENFTSQPVTIPDGDPVAIDVVLFSAD